MTNHNIIPSDTDQQGTVNGLRSGIVLTPADLETVAAMTDKAITASGQANNPAEIAPEVENICHRFPLRD